MDLSTHQHNGQEASAFKIMDSFSVKTEPRDYVENGTSLEENEEVDVHITSLKTKSSSKRSSSKDIEVKVEPESLPTKKEKKEKIVKPKADAKPNKAVKQEKTVKQGGSVKAEKGMKQETITDFVPEKKKRDRFHGLSEEEVLLRLLPDHLAHDLDIIIIGINPGLTAAYVGHHYAGPGNHFWKCLYLAGFIPQPMNAYDDYKLKDYGIGFTNIVARTTRGSADLTKKEIKEGADILTEKILKYHPKIAVFNGKGIYEVFCGNKNFNFGKQPEPFPGTSCHVYVMPSSSARCTQLPRAIDKVPFYAGLRMLRDHLRGDLPDLDDSQVTFPDVELKVAPRKIKPEELDANGVKIETGDMSRETTAKTKAGVKREVKNEKNPDGSEKPKAKRGRKPKATNPETEIQTLPENGAYNSSELSMPSLQCQSAEDMPLGVPFPSDPNYLRKSSQLEPLINVKQEVERDEYDESLSVGRRSAVPSSNLVSGWLQGFNGGGSGRVDLDTVSPYFSRNSMLSSLQNNGGVAQFGSYGGFVPPHNGPFGGFNPSGNPPMGNSLNASAPYENNQSTLSSRLRSFSHSNYPLIDDNYLYPSNPHAVYQAAGPTLMALSATDVETERYIQDISEGIPQDLLGNSKPGASRSRQSL